MQQLTVGQLREACNGHDDGEPVFIMLAAGEESWSQACRAHPVPVHTVEWGPHVGQTDGVIADGANLALSTLEVAYRPDACDRDEARVILATLKSRFPDLF